LAIVAYTVAAGLVWHNQERLLFVRAAAPQPAHAPAGWRLEPVAIPVHGGVTLRGVLVLPPVAHPAVVIYFGANGEQVTEEAWHADRTWGPRALLLVNYRGYGASDGEPGERAMVSDAAEIRAWAMHRPDLDSSRIAFHGRSLGTGVAVALAAQTPTRCLILTSPYASILDLAHEAYPWLPVGLLLRHPFDSARRAPRVKSRTLVIIGEADDVIAPRHSRRLAGRLGGPVEIASFPHAGHNDLSDDPRYDAAVRGFLDRCL